jgi:hypothetical protein
VGGKFEPWQLQERQLRLGITDPISQSPAIFYCNMADGYSFSARARPGRSSGLSVSHSKSLLNGD